MKRILIIIACFLVGLGLAQTWFWSYVHEFGHVLFGGGYIAQHNLAMVNKGGPLVTAMGAGFEVIFASLVFVLITKIKKWGIIGWMFLGTAVAAFYNGVVFNYYDWDTAGAYEIFIVVGSISLLVLLYFVVKRAIEEYRYQKRRKKEILAYWLTTP